MKWFAQEVSSGVAMMWRFAPPERRLLYIFGILIPSLPQVSCSTVKNGEHTLAGLTNLS